MFAKLDPQLIFTCAYQKNPIRGGEPFILHRRRRSVSAGLTVQSRANNDRILPGICICGKAVETFRDPQMRFPVIWIKFPVPSKNFPVIFCREFVRKLLILLRYLEENPAN